MKQMPNKQKMTLDKLAALVQNGFVEFEEKVNKRIDKIENTTIRFKNETEKKLDNLSSTVFLFKNDVSGHLDHIYKKLEDLETENISGLEEYKRQGKTLTNHETRIIKLEKSLK